MGLLPGVVIRPHADAAKDRVEHGKAWRAEEAEEKWSLADVARHVARRARGAVRVVFLSRRECVAVFEGAMSLIPL